MYPDAPWLEYGYTEPYVELAFSYPMPAWQPDDEDEGGSDISAGGVGEAFLIRGDIVREVRLPFFESQEDDVRAWFNWARRSAQAFNFKFRGTAPTARAVYLHAPMLGQGGFRPERDSQFKGLYWLTVKLRTVDGLPFTEKFTSY